MVNFRRTRRFFFFRLDLANRRWRRPGNAEHVISKSRSNLDESTHVVPEDSERSLAKIWYENAWKRKKENGGEALIISLRIAE